MSPGPLQSHGIFSRVPTAEGPSVERTLAVGNDRTDTFYLFIFEAPEPEWKKAYHEIGFVMMNRLGIDPNF